MLTPTTTLSTWAFLPYSRCCTSMHYHILSFLHGYPSITIPHIHLDPRLLTHLHPHPYHLQSLPHMDTLTMGLIRLPPPTTRDMHALPPHPYDGKKNRIISQSNETNDADHTMVEATSSTPALRIQYYDSHPHTSCNTPWLPWWSHLDHAATSILPPILRFVLPIPLDVAKLLQGDKAFIRCSPLMAAWYAPN